MAEADKLNAHAKLVDRAARWLRNSRKCCLVVTERYAFCSSQIPDAIGWLPRGFSILVECKTSRADFLRDKCKPFVRGAHPPMGHWRYYFAPLNVVTVDDLPEGWGLIEERRGCIYIVKEATPNTHEDYRRVEMTLLVQVVRRVIEANTHPAFTRLARIYGDPDAAPPTDAEMSEAIFHPEVIAAQQKGAR